MPLSVPAGHPSVFIRKTAFERSGLTRAAIDARLGLTDEEFRAEGPLICIGPIFETSVLNLLIAEFEALGLVYFDDFFELSGNWPEWLMLFAVGARGT
ncbi:MAG: hypothetical protein ABI877_08810 [Gemmatimonadaceae bacterium]